MLNQSTFLPRVGQAIHEARENIFVEQLAIEIDAVADLFEEDLSMKRQDAVDLVEHIIHEMVDYSQNEMLNEGTDSELLFESVDRDSFREFLNESYDVSDDESFALITEATLLNEFIGKMIKKYQDTVARKMAPKLSATKKRQVSAGVAREHERSDKFTPGRDSATKRTLRKSRAGDVAAGKNKFQGAAGRVKADARSRTLQRIADYKAKRAKESSNTSSGETSQRAVGAGSSTEAAKPKPTTETPAKPKPSGTPTSGSTALGAAGAASVRRDRQARATAAAQDSGRRIAAAMGNR